VLVYNYAFNQWFMLIIRGSLGCVIQWCMLYQLNNVRFIV